MKQTKSQAPFDTHMDWLKSEQKVPADPLQQDHRGNIYI